MKEEGARGRARKHTDAPTPRPPDIPHKHTYANGTSPFIFDGILGKMHSS